MPQMNRSFKAAVLGSGRFLSTLTALITAAVLSRIFAKTDYAAYRQTLLAYKFVKPFLTLGLPLALYYFLPRERERGRSILTGNLVLLAAMGCLFAVAMWGGANELLAKRFSNPSLSRLLLIYSPYALLTLPVAATSACLVSCDRVKTLTIYSVSSTIVVSACVVGLALAWGTPHAAVSGQVVAAALVFVPALFLMYRATAGSEWLPTKMNMWGQMKYAVPLGAASMVGVISKNLDKVLVSSMCTPEKFAVYVNGAMEIPLIAIITGSVTAILIPEFSGMFQNGRYAEIISLWHRAMIKCALVIFPIMAFLIVMAPHVMRVLFSAKYEDSAVPFRIYLLLLPIRITNFGAVIMAGGKSSWIFIRMVIMLALNFVLSIILIHHLGYVGAALASVIVIYVWSVPFNLAAISNLCACSFTRLVPYKTLAKIGLVAVILGFMCAAGNRWLPVSSDIARLAIAGPLYVAATLAFMVSTGLLNRDELLAGLRRIMGERGKRP